MLNENNKPKKFIISAKNIHLTYENIDCSINFENIIYNLQTNLKKFDFKYIIYKKLTKNNLINFNVILLNEKKFSIYKQENINVNINNKIYIGIYKPIKNLQNEIYNIYSNQKYKTNIINFDIFFNKNKFLKPKFNLNDLNFAYLVGLIEGDGYFGLNKNRLSVTYRFGIELHIRDENLLYYIKNLLQIPLNIDNLNKRKRLSKHNTNHISETISFDIRNKDLLKNNVFPVFDKYPMFTNKQYDYLRIKNYLIMNVTNFKDIDNYVRPIIPLNSIDNIISKNYFTSWLIGFIEAEGCFYKKQPVFEITQKNGLIILNSIKKYLQLNSNVWQENNKDNFFRLRCGNKKDILKIICFIQKAPVKLKGYKKIQYIEWLDYIKKKKLYTSWLINLDKY